MTLSEPRFIGRLVASGFVIAVSLASGVYFGFARSLRLSQSVAPEYLRNECYLEIGDTLPAAAVTVKGYTEETTLGHVIGNRSAVIMFLSEGCDACEALVRYWDKQVVRSLSADVRLVCVYDWSEFGPVGDTLRGGKHLQGAVIVSAGGSELRGLAGIHATPTTIGVSEEGRITFVMTGLDRRVNTEFLEKVFQ